MICLSPLTTVIIFFRNKVPCGLSEGAGLRLSIFRNIYTMLVKMCNEISLTRNSTFLLIFPPCSPSLGELVTTPLFDGEESYIAYPPLTNIHDDLRVELEFKPLERDGLMFFCGGKKMKVEDFVAISMVDGHVEFRYELGTGKKNQHKAVLQKKLTYLLCMYQIFSTLCCCMRPLN